MDIKSSIASKYRKGNSILFSRDSECLQELIQLIQIQKHRTLVLWALDCAEKPLKMFEISYPDEHRLRNSLSLCKAWSRGLVKMPEAKKAILNAHAIAKEIDDKVNIARIHAVAQAGSTVHVETHALGLVFYELTAIVFNVGIENCDQPVSEKINYYLDRLLYWQLNGDNLNISWAKFLLNDDCLNKEKQLSDKTKSKTYNN